MIWFYDVICGRILQLLIFTRLDLHITYPRAVCEYVLLGLNQVHFITNQSVHGRQIQGDEAGCELRWQKRSPLQTNKRLICIFPLHRTQIIKSRCRFECWCVCVIIAARRSLCAKVMLVCVYMLAAD